MVRKIIGVIILIIILAGAVAAYADGPATYGLGTLTALALSPDGGRLALGATLGVYFYDARSLAPQTFWPTADPVGRLLWSPRGDVLALIHRLDDQTQRLEVRAVDTGTLLWSQTETTPARCWTSGGVQYCSARPGWRWKWAFSPDGGQIAIARGAQIELRGSADGALLASLGQGAAPAYYSLAWSAAGPLAACCADNQTQVWDPAAGQLLDRLRVQADLLALSPDGRLLSVDGVRVWDWRRRAELRGTAGGEMVTSVAFSPDGGWVVTGSGYGPVRVWAPAGAGLTQLLRGHSAAVVDVAWAPDGRAVYSAGSNTVRVWDPEAGRQAGLIDGFNPAVRQMAWSADGRRLVYQVGAQLAAYDRETRLPVAAGALEPAEVCRTNYGYTYCYRPNVSVSDIAASPAGDLLAVATFGDVRVYAADTLALVRRLPTNYRVLQAAFDPAGARLAVAGDSPDVVLWDVAAGRPGLRLRASPGKSYVIAAAFSADGATLDALDAGGRWTRWDTASGALLAEARLPATRHTIRLCWFGYPARQDEIFRDDCGLQLGVGAVSPAAGAGVAAIGDAGRLWVVDTGSGAARFDLEAPGLRALAINAAGTRLAAALNRTVKVWRLDTGEPVLEYAHTAPVVDLAFSADGLSLASGSRDGTVQAWPIP